MDYLLSGLFLAAARICRTLVEADGSSLKQTLIRVRINLVQYTKPSHTTSMTQRQETLIETKPGDRIHLALKKLKVTFSSWPSHRRTILKEQQRTNAVEEYMWQCPRLSFEYQKLIIMIVIGHNNRQLRNCNCVHCFRKVSTVGLVSSLSDQTVAVYYSRHSIADIV